MYPDPNQPWDPNQQAQQQQQWNYDQAGGGYPPQGGYDPNQPYDPNHPGGYPQAGPHDPNQGLQEDHHNYKQPLFHPDGRVNLDADEEDLAQLDMFKIDVKDMRKYRGVSGWWTIITGILIVVLQGAALATPSWRYNSGGMLGYGGMRSWGLFEVSGKQTQYHHTMYDDTCVRMNQFMFLGGCSSPICLWYQQKCTQYRQLMYVSYTAGACLALAMVIFFLCTWWTIKFTPRSLRWASGWWPIGWFVHCGATVGYILLTDEVFENLNQVSYYPIPYYSIGFFASATSALLALINSLLGCQLYSQWNDNDMVKDDDVSTEGEEEDDEDRAMIARDD